MWVNLLEWLSKNANWLFEGLGVVIVVGIVRYWRRHQIQDQPNLNQPNLTNQIQGTGYSSPGIQVGGNNSGNIYINHPTSSGNASSGLKDWRKEERITPWIKASNGLQYTIYRLKHIHLERIDRGKCYDLEDLPTDQQKEIKSRIMRHSKVVEALRGKPGIPENRTVFPEGNKKWWVIDEWIEGESLSARLKRGPLPEKEVRILAHGLLATLQELHKVSIVARDLSPESVLIRASDGCPFITDFELAKLLTGASTVSADTWEGNPYRAPEVEEGDKEAKPQADLFSWAKIIVAAATGNTNPDANALNTCIESLRLSKQVSKKLTSCFNPSWRNRPQSAQEVLGTLTAWRA